ncbi:uncharacterized protein LOC127081313 [Lathyrus oleraceus]|uniref:uncharacterized protein LOC127081313 n=1 Tax=Pisum sativum TaxID=3888 RepID=UPI0021CF30C5|nr:uncharacterized protein LOC127081313 [Pisum sativum]
MYGLHKVGGLNRISKVPAEGHNNSFAYVMSEWAKQQGEKQGCRVSIPTMHEGNTVDGFHVSDFGAFGQPYRLEDVVALSGNSNSIFNSLKVSGQTISPDPVHFNTVGKVSGFNFDKSWPENNVPAVPKFSNSRDSLSSPAIKTPSVSSASLSVSQYGNTLRANSHFGSSAYGSRIGSYDYKFRAAGNGYVANDSRRNVDGFSELNKGPRAAKIYDNKGAKSLGSVTLLLKGQNLPVKSDNKEVFSGSTCKQGEIEAVVIATSVHTFFDKAAHLMDNTSQVGHFQKVLTAIGNFCICSIAVGMLAEIIVMYPIQHRKYRDGIDNLLVLLIGGIPIATPAVLSVTMAIGSHRLSQQGSITKRMTV